MPFAPAISHEPCPSSTAWRVALRRAAHQVLDQPPIFTDPLALSMVGYDPAAPSQSEQGWLDNTPQARVLRTSLAVRSRCAEDMLHHACQQGVEQYVILGAGLDTFAYRHALSENRLTVFEVDQPVMQAWKRTRLAAAEIPLPSHLHFAQVDFETQPLHAGLGQAGFDADRPAFVAWLGVTMYLSDNAIDATLRFVAALPTGSELVFDYLVSPSLLSAEARRAFEGLAHKVAAAGEPFQSFFKPDELADRLYALGFVRVEDLSPEELDARYCAGRTDGLRTGKLSRLVLAQV